jgi:hypothetical protein
MYKIKNRLFSERNVAVRKMGAIVIGDRHQK